MKGYAALLNPESPPSILVLLADYVKVLESLSFVFCDSVEYQSAYIELALVREGRDPWKVLVPYSCILAICDASEKRGELGFLRNNEN